jgi:hypothetical protein
MVSEFFFDDKVREGLTLVGAFPEGTTVTGCDRDSIAKKKFAANGPLGVKCNIF